MPAPTRERPPRLGRYQLGRQLGEGAAWTLWTAKDGVGPSARDVLVKWVRPAIAAELEARLRLAQAAREVRELSHSGVARTLDLVDAARTLAIVLEPLDGQLLSALIARAKERQVALPIGVAARVAIEALSALDALHALTMEDPRPSDLSASSLLLTSSGTVKVVDFELDAVADTPELVAKRAPERATGAEVDRVRADIHAVAVLLWESVTGAAFVAGSPARLDADGVRKTDRCPTAVADVVARALSREPSARFESADDMGQELFAATRGAIATPDDVAAWVSAIDAADDPSIGDRQTVRPPEPAPPAAPPNPFERRASPSGRPPPMQGRPAGKVKLTLPMGKSTPPPPPKKGATLVLPRPAAPPVPPPQRGATLRMNALPTPTSSAPPVPAPTATSAPAASPAAPAPPASSASDASSTTSIQPSEASSAPPGAPTVATPRTEAVDSGDRAPTPMGETVTQPLAVAPDPYYAPIIEPAAAQPRVEPMAPLVPPLAAPTLPEAPTAGSPQRARRARVIAMVAGGAVTLLVLLAAMSRKSPEATTADPRPPSVASERPRAPAHPVDNPIEPSVKRAEAEPATSPGDGAAKVGEAPKGWTDPQASGAAGVAPRASSSEDRPAPPPAPLRRRYNPKTI